MTPLHLPLTPAWLHLGYPWVLLALLALPLLWLYWRRRAMRPAIRYSSLQSLEASGVTRASRKRVILPVLRIAALAALIVAAARPMRPDESTAVYAEGIAIQMVVDISGSMRDSDLSPPGRNDSRLDVVKSVFRRFVTGDGKLQGRPNDLIGMIRFARYADSVCPLTLDHEVLLDSLAATEVVPPPQPGRENEDGTAIGDGLALAVERLHDLQRSSGSGEQIKIKSRIVILLTDGENNYGVIAPQQAGDLAARYGIKVYTIAAGTGRNQGIVRLPVDDTDLRKIAETTGGKHYRAQDPQALNDVYAEIDRLERTKTEERRYLNWDDAPYILPWLAAAFAALGMQTLLNATWLRKIP
ncbi:MAG: VWA domain-containing protein [Phycisphaerae bacterium]